MCLLSLNTLFLVGLALDIAGAVLLAKGLLLSSEQIARLTGTYFGWNAGEAIARAEDKVDARFGLGCLLLGFGLQAVGYFLALLGVEPTAGAGRAAAAIVIALAVAGGVVLVWRLLRRRLVMRELGRIAISRESADGEEGWTTAKAAQLLAYGKLLGYPPRDGEDKVAYARRVFRLSLPEDAR